MKPQAEPPETQPQAPQMPSRAPSPLNSAALLKGREEIEIAHQGETYRLRRTRQGKLILTK